MSRPQKAVVRYAYTGEDANQLSLAVGELVTIHSRDSEDWWDGEIEGRRGYLPAKYVELLAIPNYQAQPPAQHQQQDGEEMDVLGSSLRRGLRSHQLMQGGPVADSASMYLSSSSSVSGGADGFNAPLLSGMEALGGSFWTPSSSSSHLPSSSSSSLAVSDGPVGLTSSIFGSTRGPIFSLWSSSLGLLSGWVAVVAGAFTLAMGLYDAGYFELTYQLMGVYSMVLGGLTIVYEVYFGRQNRAAYRIPLRTLVYGALMVPLFVAYPTRVSGVLYALVALINLVSALRGESVTTRPRRLDHEEDVTGVLMAADGQSASGGPAHDDTKDGMFTTYFLDRRFAHRGRRWLLLLALLAFNLGAGGLLAWWQVRAGVGEWNVWYSAGKALVWLVLLNLLLFFATAMRHLSRVLYDAAERSRVAATRSFWNELAASVLTFLPPDPHHALLFYHRVLAGLILLFSIAHGLAHTLSFMVQPRRTLATYTDWVYTSGAFLLILLLVIYSASRREIRLASAVLFRWVHALYAPFLLLLILHAPKGFSVSALLVLLLPMALWLADLVYNYVARRRRGVPVLSVSFLRPNTIRVEASARFSKGLMGRFREGDFAYLNFPPLGRTWLPVAISSAPQAGPHALLGGRREDVPLDPLRESADHLLDAEGSALVFHLNVDSASLTSPTARWLEYFQSLGPLGATHFLLDEPGHRRATSSGRVWDQQGNKLLCIDGPHASPVAHLTKYHTCLLVSPAGGAAGLVSAMRSVLQHRWRKSVQVQGGFGDSRLVLGNPGTLLTTPDVLFVFLTLRWHEVDDLRWIVQAVVDCEQDLFALREQAADGGPLSAFLRSKHFELHIFVSGAPPIDAQVGGHGLSAAVHDEAFFGPSSSVAPRAAPITCLQLYRALKNPTSAVQRFSSVHVHRGAPNWGEQFQAVSHRATGQADVGCIYSAGPLAATLTHASAQALREHGLVDVPSAADIEAHRSMAHQLRAVCRHHSMQSGKRWIFHSDVDI